ncbi:hypothetical protein OGAPHI_006927 [Ogataea philodendri]|uniref:Uncharacterized protein n=1 Tax=Ogataea philodendri TaxID=1378263 RepID=A0A9P8NW72_9ASCO|nr:uncharacterized protein OGAPHI_006927 [Ogataea philodendri]KAH3660341.1 hypothetical protein OGAPHI_006927 [Ogataea philodendri]
MLPFTALSNASLLPDLTRSRRDPRMTIRLLMYESMAEFFNDKRDTPSRSSDPVIRLFTSSGTLFESSNADATVSSDVDVDFIDSSMDSSNLSKDIGKFYAL